MNDRPIIAITLALALCPMLACDTEEVGDPVESVSDEPASESPTSVAPTAGATAEREGHAAIDEASGDYTAVGHVEIARVRGVPWVADFMTKHHRDFDPMFESCAKVFHDAEAVTFGLADDRFEIYVTGDLDLDEASACGDKIDVDRPASAIVLDEDLFVLYRGDIEPDRARLEGLLARDPEPNAKHPIWMTGSAVSLSHASPVEHVQMWADPSKGLDAQAKVVFADEAKAAEIYGQATLGLTALRMSEHASELASAVDLDSSGDTMTVEIHATEDQMTEVLTEVIVAGHAHHGHMPPGAKEHGVHVEFHTTTD